MKIRALVLPLVCALGCGSNSPDNLGSVDSGSDEVGVDDAGLDGGPAQLICAWDQEAEELPFASGKVEGVLRGDSHNRSTTCTQQTGAGGPEKIYRLHVTERRRITIEVLSSMNTVVAIRRACDDPITEVACGASPLSPQGSFVDAGFFPPPPQRMGPAIAFASTANPADGSITRVIEAGHYFVIVDQEEPFGVGGSFSLRMTVESGPAVGTCEAPRQLNNREQLHNERFDLGMPAPRCGPAELREARFYRVTIPSGHILKAQSNGFQTHIGQQFHTFMQLHGTCDDTQCLASDTANQFGGRTLQYTNNSPNDLNAIISVGTDEISSNNAAFTISVQINKPSVNGTCAAATLVTNGTMLENQILDDGIEGPPRACARFGTGALFYKATLFPEQSITATVSQAPGSFFPFASTFITTGCGATQCLGAQDGNPEITFKNTTGDFMDVILGVSGQGKFDPQQGSGAFNLFVRMTDPVGVVTTEAASSLQVRESGTKATFKIKLNAPPKAPVTVGLVSSDPTEVSVSPAAVTFTTENWRESAVVTLTGVDDAEADGAQNVTIKTAPAISQDARFAGKDPADVVVLNQDDEPGIYTSVVKIVTTESGLKSSVPVRLNSKPTASVTLQVKSTNPLEATVAPSTLTFTPDSWNVDQIISVSGMADTVEDGEQSFELVIDGSSSTDPLWVGLPSLRIPGKNRAFAFAERTPLTLSGDMNCSIGFSQWDRRIAADAAGRLYVALVCEAKGGFGFPDGGAQFANQNVFVVTSEDGGKTFSTPTPIAIQSVSNVVLAGGPPNTAYLAGSTADSGTLMRTIDGGVTWTKVSGFAPALAGFTTVVAAGNNVVATQASSMQVLGARNASRADGTFEPLPSITGFSHHALLPDPNGVDLWQIALDSSNPLARSADGGANFTSVGEKILKLTFPAFTVAVGGNVIWAASISGSIQKYELDVDKEFRTVVPENGMFSGRALVGDTTGGVTLLDPGFNGVLRASYLDRSGKESRMPRLLDTSSGQPSAVLLEEKTVAYTYASGFQQKFGILVWP